MKLYLVQDKENREIQTYQYQRLKHGLKETILRKGEDCEDWTYLGQSGEEMSSWSPGQVVTLTNLV